ncbi:sulfatase family protein [Mariniphaga sediminis]|uniref:sulfatase family protein n=1 Tax=Mariniphaga sediminis TaxID=1628158 RepID=UPI003562CC37
MFKKIIQLNSCILLFCCCVSCNNNSAKIETPNIIFIYADNLGYGDIGCFGSQIHKTPHIDKMAKEGMRLTSLYSSSPVCTPSRASLMTGCYAQRVDMHWDDRNGAVLRPVSPKGMNPEEITIAEILRDRGYATACIGKWHLGDQPQFLPVNQGFDYFFGIPYSEDMIPSISSEWPELPLLKNDKVIEAPADLTTTTSRYVREAIRFISENKNKPFFLYFPENLPGSRMVPVVDERFRGKSVNGAWGDAVEEIDWSVGEIMKTLEEYGLEEKTIIVFTSDNGAPQGGRETRSGMGSNEPFSGPGYTTTEGGMRVPCIVKWKGKIPAGQSNNEWCTMMDWFPTFAEVSGAKIPEDRIIDGKNIWPLLLGNKEAKTPHKIFYYYYTGDLQAVREGKWKLYLSDGKERDEPDANSKLKLIDLSRDIKELNNVSEQFPEVVKRLELHANQISGELGNGTKKGEKIRPAGYVENPKGLIMK